MRAALARLAAALVTALVAAAAPAQAGPPFLTDDPETLDQGHWEDYAFIQGDFPQGQSQIAGGADINFGLAKNLQLDLVVPIEGQTGEPASLGEIELAAKYRFVRQSSGSALPDIAFYPRLFAPTAAGAYGPRLPRVFLPLWAQKDFGDWSLFGGGGYTINPGAGQQDYWQGGLAVTRSVGEALTLGGEIYGQTDQSTGSKAQAFLNAGLIYTLAKHWSVLFSGGPGIANARQEARFDAYLALEASF